MRRTLIVGATSAIAQETAIAEQRKRDDLNLLLSMLINPTLQTSNIAIGAAAGPGQPTDVGGILGGVGGLLQGISSFGGKE